MPRPSPLYRLTALLARAALPVAALALPRLRRMLAERRELMHLATPGDGKAITILLHASSAGELRQLEPVIRRLRARNPAAHLVVTWFSTSGALVGNALGASLAGALPWDTPWETAALLDKLAPSVIVIGKLDLWPELAWQAERRRIPMVMVAATVRDKSSRLRWPTRALLEPAYATLAAVGAVADNDATRLVLLGVARDRITITGDTRCDSVCERLAAATPVTADPALMVAGSTWEADEWLLMRAFSELRASHPQARLLIAPHQPTSGTLNRIRRLAREYEMPGPVALSDARADTPLMLEMEVGSLALHYRLGGMAYVGGGLGFAGLHSVLEPAAAAAAIVIGPHSTTPEARSLEGAGGLVRLTDNEDAVADLKAIWMKWLNEPAALASAGRAARAAVEAGRGAADRSVDLIEQQATCRRSLPRP